MNAQVVWKVAQGVGGTGRAGRPLQIGLPIYAFLDASPLPIIPAFLRQCGRNSRYEIIVQRLCRSQLSGASLPRFCAAAASTLVGKGRHLEQFPHTQRVARMAC